MQWLCSLVYWGWGYSVSSLIVYVRVPFEHEEEVLSRRSTLWFFPFWQRVTDSLLSFFPPFLFAFLWLHKTMAGTDNKTVTLKAATVFTVALCIAVGIITGAGSDLFQGLFLFFSLFFSPQLSWPLTLINPLSVSLEVIEGVTAPFLPGF